MRHSVTSLIAVPAMMEDIAGLMHGGGSQQATASAAAAAETVWASTKAGSVQASACATSLPHALSSVRRVLVGGGGMRVGLAPLVASMFPNATVATAYGMTEATSSVTFDSPAYRQAVRAAGRCSHAAASQLVPGSVCVGWPAPGVEVAIAAADSSSAGTSGTSSSSNSISSNGVSSSDIISSTDTSSIYSSSVSGAGSRRGGELAALLPHVGEVLTRGPHVMLGYWRDAAETQQALLSSGWLRTGDLGWLDALGRLWLLGRAKDMIKSGGENVFAAEVEAALEAHPAVAGAAVVGIPHPRLGEMVRCTDWGLPVWEHVRSRLLQLCAFLKLMVLLDTACCCPTTHRLLLP